MRAFLIPCVGLWLTACQSPSVPMLGAQATRVALGGYEFTVRHTDQRAESVRTSFARNPGTFQMLVLSRQAMEAASGCRVRDGTLYGDRVLAEAFLDCPDRATAVLSPVQTYRLP